MKASEMRKGQTVKFDDGLYMIVDYQHVKLGKGGAVYQTKLKRLSDGSIQNMRIRSEDTIEEAFLDTRPYEYLYSSGSEHVIMDSETYDQVTLDDETFGEGKKYLKPNTPIKVTLYEGKVLSIALPNTVDLPVVQTEPQIKGATAQAQYKPATVDTGLVIQVPAFIKVGDVIRIDTRTGEYVTRA
jgi:elongation factor P